MEEIQRVIALGRLGKFLKRIDRKTSRKEVLSAVDGLNISPNLKKNLLSQLINRGIITAPAFTAWAQFSPQEAISWTIEEIRNYTEKEA